MPVYARVILAAGWLLWFLPFLLVKRTAAAAAQVDRSARWGMLLQGIAIFLVWWHGSFDRVPEGWRTGLAVVFFACAALLSWTSVRALGRQFRVDAGLSPDHELVRAGVYAVLRHPIYASVLCIVLGTGILIAPPSRLLLATVVCIAGTEIRVRVEDRLLAAGFGEAFRDYQRAVRAYLPLPR